MVGVCGVLQERSALELEGTEFRTQTNGRRNHRVSSMQERMARLQRELLYLGEDSNVEELRSKVLFRAEPFLAF